MPVKKDYSDRLLVAGAVFGSCSPDDAFPQPDQVEITILREICEQRFMIDINDDSGQFIDGEFSDYALELTDPILVPPCEPFP